MKPDGPCFDAEWRLSCEVVRADRRAVDAMIRTHYIGKWPGVCTLILALEHNRQRVGAIVFALPPAETYKRYGGLTWELARLWIADGVPKNAETFLIAKAVRYIQLNRPEVRFLISYADPSAGHAGTIYKAANWLADGCTDDERKTPRFDYACALTGKKYSRKGHVPPGTELVRVARVSKHRFYYCLPERPARRVRLELAA